MKTEKKHFKQVNFFRSLRGNLIVVSNGRVKGEEFEGIILYADESETNSELHFSPHFKMEKFELLKKSDVRVSFKSEVA